MRIEKIELKNFKRFTDLTISDIPETSKLVLVIGSNGSGKSCLFDAFDWLKKRYLLGTVIDVADNYYSKIFDLEPELSVAFHDSNVIGKKGLMTYKGKAEVVKKFIGRSSIRIIPRISSNGNPDLVSNDDDSPLNYTENDTRFINDVTSFIERVNTALRAELFDRKGIDPVKIFSEFIEPLNNSLLRVFGGDELTTIQIADIKDATANSAAKLVFKKGESKINYDLLSHGEKQVIILLINFIVRQEYCKDAIIFIDEMDGHLNTALQYSLLEEIVSRWIPETAQLWTASHALGFIDYARNSDIASIIDFNLLNFDVKQELQPQSKDRMDVYEIAIPKSTISSILKGYKLVVVENKNDEHYNAALGEKGYLFLPANNNREVFLTIKGDDAKLGIRDRDYLRPDEIVLISKAIPNLKVLLFYTFENYLYHPENLAEIGLVGFDKGDYIQDIATQKTEKLIEIVAEIGTSRIHYIEFKDCIKNDGNIKPITDALRSQEFEVFYTYFNMKKHFNKKYLNKFNIPVSKLSGTKWFKDAILNALES